MVIGLIKLNSQYDSRGRENAGGRKAEPPGATSQMQNELDTQSAIEVKVT